MIYFSYIDTFLSQGSFPSGSQITQVGSYSILFSIFFSGLSLCGIIVTTQNSPRKCVRKCGIAHLDFMVQYRGAVHAISVSPASLKVACTIFHSPISFQLFFHTSCHLMSQCPSDYPQQSSAFHACLEKCFLFNGIYIRLPNDGFFFPLHYCF